MGISKITRNFQLTLPKDIRKLKSFKEGDNVLFIVEGDAIKITKADNNIIKESAGLWKDFKGTGVDFERGIRKTWKKRIIREMK